jgi:hypothetical protein
MSKLIQGREFICRECQRRIFQAVGWADEPEICGTCLHIPGWFIVDELRQLLDPDFSLPPPEEGT